MLLREMKQAKGGSSNTESNSLKDEPGSYNSLNSAFLNVQAALSLNPESLNNTSIKPDSLKNSFLKPRKFNTFERKSVLMPTFIDDIPEVLVSDTDLSAKVSQAVSKGLLRKIGSRLYTKNLQDAPEIIVRRNWHHLLKEYYPDALIADRTALENGPADDGSIFIVSSKKRKTELPGLVFNPRKGAGPLKSDRKFIHDLWISSEPRAFLENMRLSRARKGFVGRTLSGEEIEQRLDRLFRLRGIDHVNQIRDKARVVAEELQMQEEFEKLDNLIGSFQGTRKTGLKTDLANARRARQPYDPERVELFVKLFEDLTLISPQLRPATDLSSEERINLSFFESYFSNFIEGTEFDVDEAADIVFRNAIPLDRPDDAHDILGTYRIVSNYHEMSRLPDSYDDFISKLKYRHEVIMSSRNEAAPGEFKTSNNVAGSTLFVLPDLVNGTLKKGYEIYRSLEYPFHRALFMKFLISEVHPFRDGNGRIARIMMNAELVSAGEQKIVIPVVYRNNYLVALNALSNDKNSKPLIRTLDFAQRYVYSLDWRDFNDVWEQLKSTHAFMDPGIADREGIRLILPESQV